MLLAPPICGASLAILAGRPHKRGLNPYGALCGLRSVPTRNMDGEHLHEPGEGSRAGRRGAEPLGVFVRLFLTEPSLQESPRVLSGFSLSGFRYSSDGESSRMLYKYDQP